MNIFENLENLNVSEACFDSIIKIVEDLISEDRLIDDNGKKTDAYYELKDKVINNLQNKKATSSAIRKHYQKQAKASEKEMKRIQQEELPKAEYNNRIAWGDAASLTASYNHYKNKENPTPEEKQATKNLKSNLDAAVKNHDEKLKKLQDVKNKIVDASLNRFDNQDKAKKEGSKTRDLGDKLNYLKR